MLMNPAFAQTVDSAVEYGSLSGLIEQAGFLAAAVFSISFGWMKRSGSKWAPPEEAVHKATTRASSLVTMVLLAVMYTYFRQPGTLDSLAILTLISLALTLAGLFSTVYLMKTYGIQKTDESWRKRLKTGIVLGGSVLTDEAIRISEKRGGVSPDQLYEESNGRLHLVFTKQSIGRIHTIATGAFVAFQAFGSLSLAGAGLLLSIANA